MMPLKRLTHVHLHAAPKSAHLLALKAYRQPVSREIVSISRLVLVTVSPRRRYIIVEAWQQQSKHGETSSFDVNKWKCRPDHRPATDKHHLVKFM